MRKPVTYPRDSETLTNSPSTATTARSKGVQGPPNKPGQHEQPVGRVTREAYEAGVRVDEPPEKSRPRSRARGPR